MYWIMHGPLSSSHYGNNGNNDYKLHSGWLPVVTVSLHWGLLKVWLFVVILIYLSINVPLSCIFHIQLTHCNVLNESLKVSLKITQSLYLTIAFHIANITPSGAKTFIS